MKRIHLLILFYFIVSCNVVRKKPVDIDYCKQVYDKLTQQNVYTFADEMPTYPGGAVAIMKFFMDNFIYPNSQEGFQASFQLEFIIDQNGHINGSRIRNKDFSELTEFDKEALRVLSKMPKWKPGTCKNKIISVKMYLPIKF
jgi:protein TonB